MARIEQGPQEQGISSRVDTFMPDVRGADDAAMASAQLGQQVSQLGMQIADRTKKTQDSDFAFNAALEDRMALASFTTQDLQTKGPDGHADRVREHITKLQDSRGEKAPSAMAADIYRQKTGGLFTEASINAEQDQFTGIAKKSREDISNSADHMARSLLRAPNSKSFFESQGFMNDRIDTAVENGTIAPQDADKFKKQYANLGAKSLFDGYLAKGEAGLDVGRSLLKDKALTDNLTPDELDRFQKSFKSATDVRDQQRYGEAKLFMQDAIAAVAAGEQVDSKRTAEAMGVIASRKNSNPYEVARIQNEFRVATAVSNATSDLKNYPIYEWGNRAQDALNEIKGKDKTWGFKEEQQYMNMYRNHVNKMLEQTKKDAHGYAISANPEIKQLSETAGTNPVLNRQLQEKSLAFQEQMGIQPEDRKIATPGEALQWSTALQQTKNADQTNEVMKQMQNIYGPRTPMLLAQMSKENKELKGFEVAGYLDGGARRDVADSIVNKVEYKKSFDDNFSDQASKLKSEVSTQTADFRMALVEGNSDRSKIERANEFSEAIELNAKRLMARGATTDAAEAVRLSTEMVFKNFDTVSSGRTKALVSKSAYGPSSKDDVSAWIDWNTTPKGLKNLDIALPPEHLNKFTAAYGNTPETTKRAKDNFIGTLSESSRWVTNQSQDGVYLVMDNGIDPPIPLFNTSGKLVEYKYRDMKEIEVKSQRYESAMGNDPLKIEINKKKNLQGSF